MKLNQKDWSCPKKQKARIETIINQYKNCFNLSKVPSNKQYWTLSGQCATPDGDPLVGCELLQLINEGFITSNQFRGVEINQDICNLNIKTFPEIKWYNDDFYSAMVYSCANEDFSPSVVNFDSTKTPDKGAEYTAKCLALLTEVTKGNVLFIANLILRMRYYTSKNGDYMIKLLNKYPQFRYAMKVGQWNMSKTYYLYDGAGNTGSRTWMGSFIFHKH